MADAPTKSDTSTKSDAPTDTKSEAVTWAKGGAASLVSLAGETVVVRSTIASAPGSTLDGALEGQAGARLKLKVKSCKREADGRYRIEGRAVDFRREDRAAIEALLAVSK